MTALVTKLIAGSTARKTRLHNVKGELISLSRLARNGPRALATGIGRLLFGFRPEKPWISYDAQEAIADRLTPESRVLEFGSGMSTLWFARRAGRVVSVEHDRSWFELVEQRLPGNVDYRLAETRDAFLAFPEQPYDLVIVDGDYWRKECAMAALPFLAPGGTIYLDNSDHETEAAEVVLGYALANGCEVRRFTDFAPTQLFAQEGLMVTRV
jgi:SAM-dependent methyltransferase